MFLHFTALSGTMFSISMVAPLTKIHHTEEFPGRLNMINHNGSGLEDILLCDLPELSEWHVFTIDGVDYEVVCDELEDELMIVRLVDDEVFHMDRLPQVFDILDEFSDDLFIPLSKIEMATTWEGGFHMVGFTVSADATVTMKTVLTDSFREVLDAAASLSGASL